MKRTVKTALAATFILSVVCVSLADQKVAARVGVQESAEAQLRYARQITNAIPAQQHSVARRQVVLDAVTALHAIEEKWPSNTSVVAEALILQSDVYSGANMLNDALQSLKRAEPLSAKLDAGSRVFAREGSAYYRMRRYNEAATAFSAAVNHRAFRSLAEAEQLTVLSEYADTESRMSQHRQASNHLRMAATIKGMAPINRLNMLLRSLEQNDLSNDTAELGNDLAAAEQVIFEARHNALGPADAAAIANIAEQIKKHRQHAGH